MCGLPPLVILITASVSALIRGRNCWNTAGSCVGRPSMGSRACRCRIAAPSLAAASAASPISCGVTCRYGDIDGVWIAPVGAQVMMTLRLVAIVVIPRIGKQKRSEYFDVAAHRDSLPRDAAAARRAQEQRSRRDFFR